MSLLRTGYQQELEELLEGDPRFGKVSLLPWDSETFGFAAATYYVGADELGLGSFDVWLQRFSRWVVKNNVQVCSCSVPASERFWKRHLPDAGFLFVDFALRATLTGLQKAALPQPRSSALRAATAQDREEIEAIAAQSFEHGRYHADPLFPRELADRRYRDWVRRAFEGHGQDRLFVLRQEDAVEGFYHVTVEGEVSDLRLAAVSPARKGTMLGFDLYLSILHVLKGLGVRRVVTSISAANAAVTNVYSTLGFRFSEPEAVYHWHSETMRLSVKG